MESVHPDPTAQELPVTRAGMAAELAALGVAAGSTLVVHSSLSSLGWVSGGPQAVVLALLDVLGPGGTLVVPTHSGHLSDPSRWERPPVPESWWPSIRDSMPAFDRALTPTRNMGAIADTVRRLPGAVRSDHPRYSFCAVGPHAGAVTGDHALAFGLGERSPLARCYDLDADLLLLGVGHANNTSLHLAELRSGTTGTVTRESPVTVDGERRWVTFEEATTDAEDFADAGTAAGDAGLERTGGVGLATARLLSQPALVDFAAVWFRAHRN